MSGLDAGSWTALAVFVAVNFVAASSGAVFKPGTWYASLNKPAWTPPNWAFPVVWTVLFLLNAVAGWRVWEAADADAWPALTIYGASLVLNAAWSALFFGVRRMRAALIEVLFLAASLVAVMAAFAPLDPVAAWLIAPYLLWVCAAAFLNLRMIQLNPARGGAPT
jgi:tryptophan-rich sensory protein